MQGKTFNGVIAPSWPLGIISRGSGLSPGQSEDMKREPSLKWEGLQLSLCLSHCFFLGFAERLYSPVHGGPGESLGGGEVFTGEWSQSERSHRSKFLWEMCPVL